MRIIEWAKKAVRRDQWCRVCRDRPAYRGATCSPECEVEWRHMTAY